MFWMRSALLVLTVVVIVFMYRSRSINKDTWRTGYWTGKAEVHNSLRVMLSSRAVELEENPALLAKFLHDWLETELASDKALSEVQDGKHG